MMFVAVWGSHSPTQMGHRSLGGLLPPGLRCRGVVFVPSQGRGPSSGLPCQAPSPGVSCLVTRKPANSIRDLGARTPAWSTSPWGRAHSDLENKAGLLVLRSKHLLFPAEATSRNLVVCKLQLRTFKQGIYLPTAGPKYA